MAAADVASSGIEALDEILNGGFTRQRIHLIEGRPGTGKTTLALQFLLDGIRRGEKTLYITLSETAHELRSSAASHGWTLDGIQLFEMDPPDADLEEKRRQTMFHSSEVELGETAQQIFDKIDQVKPARVVIDSLSEMRMLAQNPLRYRRQILAMKRFLSKKATTALLLDDLTAIDHDLQLHSITHSVLTLDSETRDYGPDRRRVRVTKMRGVPFHSGYHDYAIRTGGLDIFPRLQLAAPVDAKQGDDRHRVVNSVAKQLDAMLGGGLQRGTSTLLMGPAGSGKSSIALSYLIGAMQRDEKAALFAFDEGEESIFERAAGLSMDIRPFIRSGQLKLTRVNPADMSPGEFVKLVAHTVDKEDARVIVIDSLNGYFNAMPEEKNLVLQMHDLLTFMNHRDVLSIVVVAQHGLVGNMSAPVDISYLSDTVLMLRFFEAGAHLRKAISVLKKRIGSHEESIREFRLSHQGLQVGEPLVGFQGILTGAPVYQGDQSLLKAPPGGARS